MNDRIARRLKLRDLHTLQAVVQCGSMAKAAARLAITQPAISKAIAEIEHTIGVPLLDRGPRGVAPTAYGRALLRHGVAVFDELRQSIEEIEFLSDPTTGELRLGTTEPLTAFVAAAVDRLSQRHPSISYQVLSGDTGRLFHELRERNLDLVVTRMPGPTPEDDFNAEILFYDALAVVASKRSTWMRRRRIELVDLVNEPWVFTPDAFLMSFVKEAFAANKLQLPRATVLTPSLSMRIGLLATGRFLGIAPSFLLKLPIPHPLLKALPVDLSNTRRPIGILTLKKRMLSPVGQLFIECAKAVARPFSGN